MQPIPGSLKEVHVVGELWARRGERMKVKWQTEHIGQNDPYGQTRVSQHQVKPGVPE